MTLPEATVDTAGMIGMVTMTRSLIAAADERPGDVAAPMQAAKDLAARYGEPDDNQDRLGFGFGPTNVGLWEMALALEAGEPDRAVSVAQTIKPERHPFKTRQSQYWMDYEAESWARKSAGPVSDLDGRRGLRPPESAQIDGGSPGPGAYGGQRRLRELWAYFLLVLLGGGRHGAASMGALRQRATGGDRAGAVPT